jgi:hypothetical protein
MTANVGTAVETEIAELRAQVAQLQTALDTRVCIEQAKGVLAERFHLPISDAFLLLRYAARSSRRNIHEVAQDVVASRNTPYEITIAIARQQRWRAAGQREHAEAHVERSRQEGERIRRMQQRLPKLDG